MGVGLAVCVFQAVRQFGDLGIIVGHRVVNGGGAGDASSEISIALYPQVTIADEGIGAFFGLHRDIQPAGLIEDTEALIPIEDTAVVDGMELGIPGRVVR